ncbi:MAG: T9SS type A sorting domain-containing protein [Bacteroidota bacterium]
MKQLLLLLALGVAGFSFSQQIWKQFPVNSAVTTSVYDMEMVEGKVYMVYNQYDGAQYKTYVDYYDFPTSSWVNAISSVTTQFTKLRTEKIGTKIYIAAHDNTDFEFYSIDDLWNPSLNNFSTYNYPGINSNWEFHTGKNADELYLLFTSGTGPSLIQAAEYLVGGNSWSYQQIDNIPTDFSNGDLQIHSTADRVYLGFFSAAANLRIFFFDKGNIAGSVGYDGLTGLVESNGSPWDNPGYVITGNNTAYPPTFYGTEDVNNLSYEADITDGNAIDINLGAATTDYNLSSDYLAKENSASYAFIMSLFSDDGVGNPNEKLYVIRRDFSQAGTVWDTLATRLVPFGTAMDQNSFRLSLDNSGHHVGASYTRQGFGTVEVQVSNTIPDTIALTTAPNGGLCANQMNELYANLEIMDFDYERVRITNAYSLNTQTSAIQVIPFGFVNGISKFKILGIPNTNTDQIVIEFTDGYDTYTRTLPAYQANTSPLNVQFLSNPVLLCENEIQIDLTTKLNYYDQGMFRLNGNDLEGTLINATTLNSIASTGILRYIVNVDGCYITALANYQIVAPPTVSATANPTTCSQNTGDATANITAGDNPNFSFYWSTGETTTSISDLAPGAYYVHVLDDNGCKATALASVNASDITFTSNVTHPSCFGAKDGIIDLTVTTSASAHQIVWSTGNVSEDMSNRGAGSYEYTYYDNNGCEIQNTVDLIDPAPITDNLVINRPDCATANGSILTNASGGAGGFTYLWNTSAVTANLTGIQQGFYAVTITDQNGCILRDSVMLNDNFATIIGDSLILAGCGANNGGINVNLTDHPNGGPVNSILWSTGETTEDIFNLSSGTYMITVNSGPNCVSQKVYNLGVRPPLRNDICVVTVDLVTTTNLVVWEKVETEGISHYNIYRENTDAGTYMLIDTVQYSNLSVFNDVVASPLQRSWRYRISAVNTCGVEGPFSENHKTLHLNTINQAIPGIVDIYWDSYEGITTGQYVVYRYTDQNNWVALSPAVPYGGSTMFTDTPPAGETGLDYYVDLELQTPCTATFKAQDFNRSRSNKERGLFAPGTGDDQFSNNGVFTIETENASISVYPNPFGSQLSFVLEGLDKATVELVDINGRTLQTFTCTKGLSTLDTQALNSGIYFLKTSLNGQSKTFKISK